MTHTAAHRAEASNMLSPKGKQFFKFIEFDDNERLLLEVRKHPFGLLIKIVGGLLLTFFVTIIPIALAMFINQQNVLDGSAGAGVFPQILVGLGLLFGLVGIILVGIGSFLYVNNVIFVTSEKVAQVLYISLFHRKISQLSIGDVQDVTVSRKGIFPTLLNYGTLVIETAGEQQNYTFTYVPQPNETSRTIVEAHEENMKEFGN